MKLYSVSDGPPSLACRQLLKALNIQYQLIDVDFGKAEHMTEEYAKVYSSKGTQDIRRNKFVKIMVHRKFVY